MKCIVIGGGIIGLSSAFYLQESGWDVTVFDKGDFENNCSFGNAGYISPSHFIPLASPGLVKQALKWMFNSSSPFYIQPRLNWPLIRWGLKFMQIATNNHVDKSQIPLRDLGLSSLNLYDEWKKLPDFDFYFEHKGIVELYLSEEKAHHARHVHDLANKLGLESELLSREQVRLMEPQISMNVLGGLHFKCDAHCNPNDLMKNLKSYLKRKNVKFIQNQAVTSFEKQNGKVNKVLTNEMVEAADLFVVATGAWSREIIELLDTHIPLMPGRGYSITLQDERFQLNYPAILVEGRVAVTPMNGDMRFGGTLEIVSVNTPPRINRVKGILKAVKQFYPEFDIPVPDIKDVWYGYRPCSADGLPYIGRLKKFNNVIVATGHAMVGLSYGAGTGKLVAELANGKKTFMNTEPFSPERFS